MPSRRKRDAEAAHDSGVHSDVDRNYIIHVPGRGTSFSMSDAQALLRPAGVVLDEGYGPIVLNRAKGDYVLRGRASSKARQEAERSVPGIRFFGDARIGPASSPVGDPR
jgi:hypothetical protein